MYVSSVLLHTFAHPILSQFKRYALRYTHKIWAIAPICLLTQILIAQQRTPLSQNDTLSLVTIRTQHVKILFLVLVLCKTLKHVVEGLTDIRMTAHFKSSCVYTPIHLYKTEAFCRCYAELFISLETQKPGAFCKSRKSCHIKHTLYVFHFAIW